MNKDNQTMFKSIINVFEKYDKTDIPSYSTDTPVVDLVTEDTISITNFFSMSDGVITQEEVDIYNDIFTSEKTAEELASYTSNEEEILSHIGKTFNIIALTEKELGIYHIKKTMIVPLIKFYESVARDIISSSDRDDNSFDAYNRFFYKIESALTAIPE